MPSFDLLVDIKASKLIDRKILVAANGKTAHCKATQRLTCNVYGFNAQVLHNFKYLATINANKKPIDVKFTHNITTRDPPTFARTIRLAGEKLLAAKKEFE